MKEIAIELAKGNFQKASDLGRELVRKDASAGGEVIEIARQAMISSLKKGKVSVAKEINRAFSLPEDVLDETIQQAVMSSFYAGDIEQVKKLKNDLPIKKELSKKIVNFSTSWGRKDRSEAIQALFA